LAQTYLLGSETDLPSGVSGLAAPSLLPDRPLLLPTSLPPGATIIDLGITTGDPASIKAEYARLVGQIDLYTIHGAGNTGGRRGSRRAHELSKHLTLM
jgi:hypothetical protein